MTLPFARQGYYPKDDDYYVILDVDFNAPPEAISSAYKNLARKYHPDKNNQDDRSRREAQIIFTKIQTAYEVLSDPRKRKIYDALGPQGVKMDEWQLVTKQMTAQEIREEYLRFLEQRKEMGQSESAKTRSSLTIGLDATSLFPGPRQRANLLRELGDEEDDSLSFLNSLASVEISDMSANISVKNFISASHSTTLQGYLRAKNGIGDGNLGASYHYKHSQSTNYDLSYQGNNLLTAGFTHHLNDKTVVSGRGMIIIHPYKPWLGVKLTLAHKFRNNLVGTVSYREGIKPSVTTALIYSNEKLMLKVTTSYKLSLLNQVVSVDFDYKFSDNKSNLKVSLAASSNEGVYVAYGCETRISELNVIGAALTFSLPSGITLKLRLEHANQEFNLPIYLSDEVHSAPIFYGTVVPLLAYYLLDRCYLKHYKRLG